MGDLLAAFACCRGAPRARAQFAVIDVASVAQLIQQAQTLTQQLAAARAAAGAGADAVSVDDRHRGMQHAA